MIQFKPEKSFRASLLVIAVFILPHIGQSFYNPNTGTWLNRDPIGQQGGANLTGFLNNNPSTTVDLLGQSLLPIQPVAYFACQKCKCKSVKLRDNGIEPVLAGNNYDTFRVGASIKVNIDVEGAPQFCKCRGTDKGHVTASINGRKYDEYFDDTKFRPLPCNYTEDSPGVSYGPPIEPGSTLTGYLSLYMTVHIYCDGTDGSHADDKITVRVNPAYKFTVPIPRRFPPPGCP